VGEIGVAEKPIDNVLIANSLARPDHVEEDGDD